MDHTERQFMKNRFSLMLLAIQLTLLATGVFLIASGVLVTFWVKVIIGLPMTFIGFISLAMGLLMFLGLRSADPSPTKIWLLTWFGNKTDVVVTSWPVLLLDWIWGEPVGKIEFSLQRVERQIKMAKTIKCKDGNVTGFIDTASVIDCKPSIDKDGLPVTVADKLNQLDNLKGHEGALNMLAGLCTGTVQAIAKNWSIADMQYCTAELAAAIVEKVQGLEKGDGNALDDVRGLSLEFTKFVPVFEPSSEVIKAGDAASIEMLERTSQGLGIETNNELIFARFTLYKGKIPIEQCRNEVVQELALAQGKYTEVKTGGGLALVNANP